MVFPKSPKSSVCSKCHAPAAVFLAYAPTHLCGHHFMEMFEKRFRKTIRELGLIKKNSTVALALSGGKDSTVLLHLLSDLQRSLPFKLVAITIDEGIANYRSKTLIVAKRECKKLRVPLRVVSFKKESGKKLDEILRADKSLLPCSVCGVFRRHLLNKSAKEAGANLLAIGHNLDDMAQTVLMNLMRNEPLRLVRFGEPLADDEKFVPRIRPLMRAPEKEVAIYAMLKGFKVTFTECPYAHSALRQEIRNHLNELEEKYPGTKIRIFNSFVTMDGWMRKGIGNGFAGQKFKRSHCKTCGEPSSAEECAYCGIISKL
ncbi:TPA: TIGR00269 family protein [Candidatus Micrarchaeota archaeon]|nr:TIGR00269 family protein [Candidatus Micrarchaeota archaeon]